jgi:ABC-type antimicrobial peptide transport system permease subunit
MNKGNWKLAMQSIRGTKWRSLFTMLGIIIGVVSVLTILSLGEGVKKEVAKQVESYGSDLIIVKPGGDTKKSITSGKAFSGLGAISAMNDSDIEVIEGSKNIQAVVPLASVNGVIGYDGNTYPDGAVIATTSIFPTMLNHKVEFGEFFSDTDEGRKFAVIGKNVAEQVFKENVPVGKTIEFRGDRYIVKGVMEEFDTSPFSPGGNYNDAVFIPFTTGQAVNEGASTVFQVIVKPTDKKLIDSVEKNIFQNLLAKHGGQEDFSVLKQEETLKATNSTLDLLTRLIALVAAISLFVGGIGVMNVMIVSVTERTHEIGVRKAIGATDGQILGQFLSEAVLLSAVGGFLGVLISFFISMLFRIFTDFVPIITLTMVLGAFLISVLVGAVFGVAPAVKAATKDPIKALRRE